MAFVTTLCQAPGRRLRNCLLQRFGQLRLGRQVATLRQQSAVSDWFKDPLSNRSFSSSFLPYDDGAGQLELSAGKNGVHDVGGLDEFLGKQVDLTDPALRQWEQETHALLIALVKHGYLTTDELRRHIESMQKEHYIARTYYCKWATAIALGLIERGVLDYTELDNELLGSEPHTTDKPEFHIGQYVQVKSEQNMSRWRKPHLRTPGYIFGVTGQIESYEGCFADPSFKAFQSMLNDRSDKKTERKDHLYRVIFSQKDVWPEGNALRGIKSVGDTATVDVYQSWLMPSAGKSTSWETNPEMIIQNSTSPTDRHRHHHRSHDHKHDRTHDHDHDHLPRADLEQRAIDLEVSSHLCSTGSIQPRQEPTTLVGDRLSPALIALLSRPQHFGPTLKEEIRSIVDGMETLQTRADGTTLVVEAWMDPAFEQRLLKDAASAALELGINAVNATASTKLKVVKSRLPTATDPGIHNLITCTLCSCYPLSLLGLSPKWYKSRSFRARAVREPRAMLKDSFALDLSPEEWSIRVHDSTADLRYLVLPPRPAGTEKWSKEELRQIVTRDCMIGVALPKSSH